MINTQVRIAKNWSTLINVFVTRIERWQSKTYLWNLQEACNDSKFGRNQFAWQYHFLGFRISFFGRWEEEIELINLILGAMLVFYSKFIIKYMNVDFMYQLHFLFIHKCRGMQRQSSRKQMQRIVQQPFQYLWGWSRCHVYLVRLFSSQRDRICVTSTFVYLGTVVLWY